MTKITSLLITLVILVASCSKKSGEFREGIWRATLKTATGAEIPFNFQVIDSAGNKRIEIINGKERFRVNEIITKADSVNIRMPLFDSEIKSVIGENGYLYGKFIRHRPEGDSEMEFNAQPDVKWRFFSANVNSDYKVDGRWSVTFTSDTNPDTTLAVGEFVQKDATVTGTFLTTTGDYRFLEGIVSDNKLYLSSFDGSNSLLFTAQLTDNNTITDGKFYSGPSDVENWTAKRDEKAVLPDSYSLTTLKSGHSSINFSFPDLNGKKVSLADEKFKNKVVVLQLLGTWCPNCMDETAYLAPFYNKYKSRGVEVLGLAYERTADFEKSKKNIERLKKRLNVGYDILITGVTNDKNEVAKSLPALSTFMAFPTTVVIDKKGTVRKIHTGFTGPGTGSHYTAFITEFEKTIGELVNE
jgi:peroxiredoxin